MRPFREHRYARKTGAGVALLMLAAAAVAAPPHVSPDSGTEPPLQREVQAAANLHGDLAGLPRVFPELFSMPDPPTWEFDPISALHYRRTTAGERTANNWPAGTFFAETDGLSPGAPHVKVLLPLPLGSAEAVRLSMVHAERGSPLALVYSDRPSEVRVPSLHRYASEISPGPLQRSVALELVLSDDGGYYGRGLAAGAQVQLLGPEAWWTLDALPTPRGTPLNLTRVALVELRPLEGEALSAHCLSLTHACTLATGPDEEVFRPMCSNGFDDDLDAWTDYPFDPDCASAQDDDEFGRPYYFGLGLFGEKKWCTRNQANLEALMHTMRGEIVAGFAIGPRPTRVDFSSGFSQCWIARSEEEAVGCDRGSIPQAECAHDPSSLILHGYTFYNCRGDMSCYLLKAWRDVEHTRRHAELFAFGPLHLAQVVHLGAMSGPVYSWFCGAAYPSPSGNSVSRGLGVEVECSDYSFVNTHEIGHNFDAEHDLAERVVSADTPANCWTVMKEAPPCVVNYFSNPNRRKINNCVKFNTASCPVSSPN